MEELHYEKGKDILLKLDDKYKLTGIYGYGVDLDDARVALIASLTKVCQDWKSEILWLGLHADQQEFDKQKAEEKKDISADMDTLHRLFNKNKDVMDHFKDK